MKQLFLLLSSFVLLMTGCVPVHIEGTVLPVGAATATAEARHSPALPASDDRSLATFLPHLDVDLTPARAVTLWGQPDEVEEAAYILYKYGLSDGLTLWLQFASSDQIVAAGIEAPDGTLTQLELQPMATVVEATPTPGALHQIPTPTPIPAGVEAIEVEPTVVPVEVTVVAGEASEGTATPLPTVVPPTVPPVEAVTPALGPVEAIEVTATALPTVAPPTVLPAVVCVQCGEQPLLLHNGEVQELDLPSLRDGVFYDYAAATDSILYGSQFPDEGKGPGNLSVTDLYLWDRASGESTVLIAEEEVVRALWAPDGQHFVYLRAVEDAYQLRWRSLDGDDRLLATGAALAFNPSPSGDEVAFTRESDYNLDIDPGIYIVDVATGVERQVSGLDKAGTGRIDDRPWWSPDEKYLLLNLQRDEDARGLFRILTDGSSTVAVEFDPSLSDEVWYDAQPFSPLWLDRTHLIGTPTVYTESAPLGGEPLVLHYQLNETLDTIIEGTLIAEGWLIGWNMPGQSVWVYTGKGAEVVPLP